MKILPLGGAASVIVGPFLDDSDGVTPLTGLTLAATDVKLLKYGASSPANKNDANAPAHVAAGHYLVEFNNNDLSAAGYLRVVVSAAGSVPVWEDFMVVPTGVYDALLNASGSGLLATIAGWDTGVDDALFSKILGGDLATVSAPADRSLLNAARFLRNKWSVNDGVLTVTEEDDTTTAWTAVLDTDSDADPVIGADPS